MWGGFVPALWKVCVCVDNRTSNEKVSVTIREKNNEKELVKQYSLSFKIKSTGIVHVLYCTELQLKSCQI